LAKRFHITIGNKSYDVEVGDPTDASVTVTVDGETFLVAVQPASGSEAVLSKPGEPGSERPLQDGPAAARSAAVVQAAGGDVTAPMPGTILEVGVRLGDAVEPGQALCALEAMKMKSPIRAPRGGTIRQVRVEEGQSVDHGDLLFVVE
jgi:biotin carboxyl carrier protein